MEHPDIQERFARYLSTRSLKLTSQRERIFNRAFATHDHFTAETLYDWMREEDGPRVSRATVYRTLNLLEEGGFIGSLDTGRGEVIYEHLLGHPHHDHLICLACGSIEEFHQDEIEALQAEIARSRGFRLVRHTLRLEGYCQNCSAEARQREADRP